MPEVVAQSNLGTCPYTSGGGFSTYHPTPLYQLENVKNYLALVVNDTALRPAPGYNGAGRGYPDVTMQGYSYISVTGAHFYRLSGTSTSCPVMAGLISTLNAARMRIGKGAVGFVHPALYKHSSKFTNDVVGGNIKCTQNGQICCTQGFYATPGWDPASGLGSINYGKMEAVFLTLGKEANALTPSSAPTSANPSVSPTARPSSTPTLFPSLKPTSVPSTFPTQAPVNLAMKSPIPSCVPTSSPSTTPSVVPSVSPTAAPTMIPSSVPTSSPSARPSAIPSAAQTTTPSSLSTTTSDAAPSAISSVSPTAAATMIPSYVPTSSPSAKPSGSCTSVKASSVATRKQICRPTKKPSHRPLSPSEFLTSVFTSTLTELPSSIPSSLQPSEQLTTTLSISQLTNAPSDPPSSGLHGNGQIDLLPTNSFTIKTSGSIRAIQVDIR